MAEQDHFLITGATGFIGQNLIQHSFFDNKIGACYRRTSKWSERNFINFNPTYIFHLAGEIYDESKMFASNVEFTYKLLQLTKNVPYKAFIYVGSSSEYGNIYPKIESMAPVPTNLYSATKGCGTLLCQAFALQHSKPIAVVRPFSIYGPYDKSHKFIPTLFRSVRKGQKVTVYNGSHDWIHVNDFLDGLFTLVKALENNRHYGQVFNLGTEKMHTNREVVETLENVIGKLIDKEYVDDLVRPYDHKSWVADTAKTIGMLRWTPRINLSQGLKLEWER